MLNDKVANAIIGVVTFVWAINFGARFFVAGYEPQESINAIFMAIAGGAFALKSRNGNGKSGEDKKPEDKP